MISIPSAGADRKHSEKFMVDRANGTGVYDLVLFLTRTVIEAEGKLIVVKPNTMILFDRFSRQHYYSEEELLVNDFVHFDPDAETEEKLLENMIFNKPFQVEQTDVIRRLMWLISYEYNNAYPNREEAMELHLRALIKKVEEEISLFGKRGNYSNFAQIVSIKSLIRQNPQENWTIRRLADECSMSKSQFQAVYKQVFGTNPIADVIFERLKRAQTLVSGSSTSIQDIATLCGYNNIEHFSRQFKKAFGITPLQYRKNFRNNSYSVPVDWQGIEELVEE